VRPFCIYHGNCADGFGAAWVVRRFFNGEVDFHAGVYQTEPPDVTGRDVIMVDFSYKRPVLKKMADAAKSILIIDHHKTAAEDLAGLTPAVAWPLDWAQGERICAAFDMDRSGAGMTWDFFFPGKPRPALINHIEDRDLWRFKINGTREIQAAVFSYPYDFQIWDELLFGVDAEGLRREGEAIERKHFKDIAELVKVMRRSMVIGGIEVPVANLPYTLTSDAGHQMAVEHPSKIGVCYWDTPEGRIFSLRSTNDGPDVSAIAKQYGGSGHAHAAGFKITIGWEGEKP
jgi:uncharacterized protein